MNHNPSSLLHTFVAWVEKQNALELNAALFASDVMVIVLHWLLVLLFVLGLWSMTPRLRTQHKPSPNANPHHLTANAQAVPLGIQSPVNRSDSRSETWKHRSQKQKVQALYDLLAGLLSQRDHVHSNDILSLRPDQCSAPIQEMLLLKDHPAASEMMLEHAISQLKQNDVPAATQTLSSSLNPWREKLKQMQQQVAILERVIGFMQHLDAPVQALEHFERAQKVFPQEPALVINHAILHLQQGDFAQAQLLLDALLKNVPPSMDPEILACAHANLGLALRANGDLKRAAHHHLEAVVVYRQLKNKQGQARHLAEHALTLQMLEQSDQGLRQIQQALSVLKDQNAAAEGRMRLLKAQLLAETQDRVAAVAELEALRSNKKWKNDPEIKQRIRDTLAALNLTRVQANTQADPPRSTAQGSTTLIEQETVTQTQVYQRTLKWLQDYVTTLPAMTMPVTEPALEGTLSGLAPMIQSADWRNTTEVMHKALQLAEKKSLQQWLLYLNHELGRVYLLTQQHSLAMTHLSWCLQQPHWHERSESPESLALRLGLSIASLRMRNWSNARSQALNVQERTQKPQLNYERALACSIIACADHQQLNLMDARSYYHQALKWIPKKHHDARALIASCLSLTCIATGHIKEAEGYLLNAANDRLSAFVRELLAQDLLQLAEHRRSNDHTLEAGRLQKKAEKTFAKLGFSSQSIRALTRGERTTIQAPTVFKPLNSSSR